jgi:hypothetical protein
MNAADLADVPEPLRTALLADTRDVVGGDGRVAEDVPCVQCGYNQRSLPGDGRCPECGHDVATTLRERTGFRPVRLWLYGAGCDLSLAGWALLCVAAACLVVPLGLLRSDGDIVFRNLSGLAWGLLLVAGVLSITGCCGATAPPPPVAAALRGHLKARRLARVSFLFLPVLFVLYGTGILPALLARGGVAATAVTLITLAAFPGLLLVHLRTLLRLAGPPPARWPMRSASAGAVCALTGVLAVASRTIEPDTVLVVALCVALAAVLLSYGYALRQTGRVFLQAAKPDPRAEGL